MLTGNQFCNFRQEGKENRGTLPPLNGKNAAKRDKSYLSTVTNFVNI